MINLEPNVLRRILASIALLTLLSLGGCASVPMATPQQDAAAKQFTVPTGKSRIYLYRNENFGGAIKMTVSLDGKTMGQTGPKTFFIWDVTPGHHTIESLTENVAKLSLDTQAGQPYFVWQEVKMGMLSAGSVLHLVDRQAGMQGVMECNLASTPEH